jgi:uncharacterized protein
LAQREVTLSGELDLGKLPRLRGLLHSEVGSVRAALRFRQRRDSWLGIELDYELSAELKCQRCLEPFRHEAKERVGIVLAEAAALPETVPEGFEPFEVEGGRLKPAELVEDELIVAIPLVPKHPRIEDCGSLARYSAERNERSVTVDR